MATSTATTRAVCESCQEAVRDEDGDMFGLSNDEAIALAVELGADIADHCCDTSPQCGCGCNQRYRRYM